MTYSTKSLCKKIMPPFIVQLLLTKLHRGDLGIQSALVFNFFFNFHLPFKYQKGACKSSVVSSKPHLSRATHLPLVGLGFTSPVQVLNSSKQLQEKLILQNEYRNQFQYSWSCILYHTFTSILHDHLVIFALIMSS